MAHEKTVLHDSNSSRKIDDLRKYLYNPFGNITTTQETSVSATRKLREKKRKADATFKKTTSIINGVEHCQNRNEALRLLALAQASPKYKMTQSK